MRNTDSELDWDSTIVSMLAMRDLSEARQPRQSVLTSKIGLACVGAFLLVVSSARSTAWQ